MMKILLMFILISSSFACFSQDEMDAPVELDSETMIDPETTYESEMFAQKQDEVTSYSSSPLIDSSDDYTDEEEVYDSESDY